MKPTPEQLTLIQSYGSADLPAVDGEGLEVVRFIATDNLIARGKTKWSIEALDSIAKLLAGRPFELNHDWEDVGKVAGLVFSAKKLSLNRIPQELIEDRWNAQIFNTEGYHPVVAEVVFPSTSTLLSGLQLGALQTVSIGGFKPTDYICPLCNTSFSDEDCPHVPPTWWNEDSYNLAPYAIRADTTDMGELSLVVIPDVKGASLISNKYGDLYNG